MSVASKLKRKARGERPYFFDDPNVDRVIAMVMGLAGEVAVLHDRLDTLERLVEKSGGVKRAEIDAYKPTAAVAAERAAWREGFLSEVLRIIESEVEALATGDTAKYDTAIKGVETDAPVPTRKPARAAKPAKAAKAAQPAKPPKPAARKK